MGLVPDASPPVTGTFRKSVGLAVRVLAKCNPPAGSSEYRDVTFDDVEFVRPESLRELFRRLSVSCVRADALLR